MVERAFAMVPRDEIYAVTGIQFMVINTLYQLLAMASTDDPLLRHADRLLMMADLFAHFLSGSAVTEYTLASTSQALDARSRDWARPLLDRLGIPTALLPEVVPPGTDVGPLLRDLAAAPGLADTRVVLAGSHDTASAVVGTPLASRSTAYLSSGTWSLIGLEVPEPVISEVSLAANLTNEGGVADTIRLLRNVAGSVAGPGEPACAVARRWRAIVREARRARRARPGVHGVHRPRRRAVRCTQATFRPGSGRSAPRPANPCRRTPPR